MSFPVVRIPPCGAAARVALAALAVLWTPVAAPAQARTVVLTGLTVVDGLGGLPRRGVTVVVEDGRIAELATGADAARAAVRPGAWVLALDGATVVPGLIDSHVHVATVPDRAAAEARLLRMLRAGITSVRDMAGDARLLADLARAARLDEIEAPDVYYSALMAGPTFLADPRPQASSRGTPSGEAPWMQAVTPGTDMVRAVARAKGTWATGVKVYSDLEASQVRRIAAEAHAQGLKVWAHGAVFPTRPQDVVGAGADVVSHACRLAWAAMDEAPLTYARETAPDYASFTLDHPAFDALFAEMADRGTILDATLALYERQAARRSEDPGGRAPTCDVGFARRLVRRAHERGVSIAAGTDFDTPADSPPALFEEVEALVREGGLPPGDALRAATVVGARVLGIDVDTGTLEVGKVADLVVVDGDPTRDISALRRVRLVMKHGRVVVGGP